MSLPLRLGSSVSNTETTSLSQMLFSAAVQNDLETFIKTAIQEKTFPGMSGISSKDVSILESTFESIQRKVDSENLLLGLSIVSEIFMKEVLETMAYITNEDFIIRWGPEVMNRTLKTPEGETQSRGADIAILSSKGEPIILIDVTLKKSNGSKKLPAGINIALKYPTPVVRFFIGDLKFRTENGDMESNEFLDFLFKSIIEEKGNFIDLINSEDLFPLFSFIAEKIFYECKNLKGSLNNIKEIHSNRNQDETLDLVSYKLETVCKFLKKFI